MNNKGLEGGVYNGRRLVINREGKPYLKRLVITRNRFFSIYLHKTVNDDYPVLHDHPWNNLSIILRGGYYETTAVDPANPRAGTTTRWYGPGRIIARPANKGHRLSLREGK
jgi:hypothetical protein